LSQEPGWIKVVLEAASRVCYTYIPRYAARWDASQERQVICTISFNLVTFIGNVGRDSDLQETPSGSTHARFSLAVDSFSGKEKEAMWLSVSAWGNLAEQVSKVVKKGSTVLVSGRLAVRTFTGKDQKEHTTVEVIANVVQVLRYPGAKEDRDPEPMEEEELAA
jgi:single-strand DNA-binding protein